MPGERADSLGSGISVNVASVNSRTPATETAFSSAMRTTFVGSMIPASTETDCRDNAANCTQALMLLPLPVCRPGSADTATDVLARIVMVAEQQPHQCRFQFVAEMADELLVVELQFRVMSVRV